MIKLLAIIIVTISTMSLSFGGTIDPRKSDSEYLEYGKQHQCVLPIECIIYLNEKNTDNTTTKYVKYIASCVAISPRWIVTAAHVVKDSDARFILYKDKKIEVDICAYHSEFDDKKFGASDIALCHLSEDLELDFYPSLYENNDEVGKVSSQAGYGATGTFSTGATKNDQQKRAGSNIIQGISGDLLMCSVHEGKTTALEFMIANGDSGGGLFIDKKLAGIHSCVLALDGKPNSDHGDESGHTRISVFKKWIENTIETLKDSNDK